MIKNLKKNTRTLDRHFFDIAFRLLILNKTKTGLFSLILFCVIGCTSSIPRNIKLDFGIAIEKEKNENNFFFLSITNETKNAIKIYDDICILDYQHFNRESPMESKTLDVECLRDFDLPPKRRQSETGFPFVEIFSSYGTIPRFFPDSRKILLLQPGDMWSKKIPFSLIIKHCKIGECLIRAGVNQSKNIFENPVVGVFSNPISVIVTENGILPNR